MTGAVTGFTGITVAGRTKDYRPFTAHQALDPLASRETRAEGFTFQGLRGPGFFTGLRGARVSRSVPRRRKARSLATKTLTEASCVSTSGHTCAVHVELQLVGILSTNHGILTGKHMRVVVFFCSSQRTAIGRLPP